MSERAITERDILQLMPADTPSEAAPAWVSALEFALHNDATMQAYRLETKDTWSPATTPIGQMVDEAAGADWMFLNRFVAWFNVNVWGDWE